MTSPVPPAGGGSSARAVVFLGPSLGLDRARAILDAVYLPPAGQADLLSAVTTYRPSVIGLIDGVFGQSLSVWHKEILFALEQGVRVYGAASLGALRAAETATFGMVGVGEVYRLYASGETRDDDEVALAHGGPETGYRPLSEPMVNLRRTFERARDQGVVDARTCRQLIAAAKSIYFPERTLPAVFAAAAAAGAPAAVLRRVERFAAAHYVDLKGQDAALLLRTIRDLPEPPPPAAPGFRLTRSRFFDALYERDRRVRRGSSDVPLHAIADYAALHDADFGDVNFQAMNRALAALLARLMGVEALPEDVDQAASRFRRRYDLQSEPALAAWLRRNDLTRDEFRQLMQEVALCRRMHRWLMERRLEARNTKLVLDELRLRDSYAAVADAAASHERVLDARYPDFAQMAHDATLPDLLDEHLRVAAGTLDGDATAWAEEAGFGTLHELRVALLRARLVRRERQRAAAVLDRTPTDT